MLDMAKEPCAAASGVPVGVVSCHASPDDNPLSQLTRAGLQATVAFADNERIENVAIGDSNSWQVTPNKRANLLFVKPLAARARTNMTVVTDRHTYVFDLVTAGQLFENVAPKKHWLEIRLEGDGKSVNRSAIGAQVRISLPKGILTRQVEAGTGEGNQNDHVLHFGLGDHTLAVGIEIFWPDGKRQAVQNIAIDRLLTVRYGGQP